MDSVPQLEINVDTVYERYNIKDIHTEEQSILWEYDENQLSMEEYLTSQAKEVGFKTGSYIGTGENQIIFCPKIPKIVIINGQIISFEKEDDKIIIKDAIEDTVYYSYLIIYY